MIDIIFHLFLFMLTFGSIYFCLAVNIKNGIARWYCILCYSWLLDKYKEGYSEMYGHTDSYF